MNPDDPAVRAFLRQSMIARVATLSRNGRPSVTPIYFVCVNGNIWVGTSEWTLAARDAKADPRVVILFEAERGPRTGRVLRIAGRAVVRTDPQAQRAYNLRTALKYVLTPGGLRHYLGHLAMRPLMRRYHAQSAEKGRACVIEVTPEEAVFLEP